MLIYLLFNFQDDVGLQRALVRTRLLKRRAREEDFGTKFAAEIAAAGPADDEAINGSTGAEFIGTFADDAASNRQIILNETSEFCRHLGAWRANETTGMGESVSKEILDFESSLKAPAVQSRRGHWEEVRSDSENDDDGAGDVASDVRKKKSASASTFTILDEEPNLAKGLAGAIKMASTKGYFESKEKEKKGSNLAHLQAKSYTIEDKLKDDDRG